MHEGLTEAARRGVTIPANFPELMAASAARLATEEGADPEHAAIFARNLAIALTTPEPPTTSETDTAQSDQATQPEAGSVWDWAMQPATYTGKTRTLEYTRDRDAAEYRLCQPGEIAYRLVHQREYRHGTQTGWETTGQEDIS
jgi:hypothetical protein